MALFNVGFGTVYGGRKRILRMKYIACVYFSCISRIFEVCIPVQSDLVKPVLVKPVVWINRSDSEEEISYFTRDLTWLNRLSGLSGQNVAGGIAPA